MGMGNGPKKGMWDDFGRKPDNNAIYTPVDYSIPIDSAHRTIITVSQAHVSVKVELLPLSARTAIRPDEPDPSPHQAPLA